MFLRGPARKTDSYNQSNVCGPLSSHVSTTVPVLPSSSGVPVVYCDGCCFNNGRTGASAGIGVYWGEDSPRLAVEGGILYWGGGGGGGGGGGALKVRIIKFMNFKGDSNHYWGGRGGGAAKSLCKINLYS